MLFTIYFLSSWTLLTFSTVGSEPNVANNATSSSSSRLFVAPLDESVLFVHDQASVGCYRIPIVTTTSRGTVIVAAEARKLDRVRWDCDDEGPKFIAIRRSTDDGATWQPMQFVFNDPGHEGLSLGTIFEEETSHTIFIQFTHNFFTPGNTIGFVVSRDEGRTWTLPLNVSKEIGTFSFVGGPGYGIQKRFEPHKGRLMFCGHSDIPTDGVYLVYSDDKGKTWHWGGEMPGIPYGRQKTDGDFNPDECQLVEMPNGDIVVNARNENHYNCRCRIKIVSGDGGSTFSLKNVSIETQLPDLAVAASIYYQDSVIFFSNPYNAQTRKNMTLSWSMDGGETWNNQLKIWNGGSGYSGLTSIKSIKMMGIGMLGLVFEKGPDESTYWHTVTFVRLTYIIK